MPAALSCFAGNRVNIGWLLLCVFPADGVRVAKQAGQVDAIMFMLRVSFGLRLPWGTVVVVVFVVVVFVVTTVVRAHVVQVLLLL